MEAVDTLRDDCWFLGNIHFFYFRDSRCIHMHAYYIIPYTIVERTLFSYHGKHLVLRGATLLYAELIIGSISLNLFYL